MEKAIYKERNIALNCIYIIKKITGEVYCKKLKCKITNECRICELKDFAQKEQKKMKQKSKRLAKLERERFTILDGLSREYCNECGKCTKLETNELFTGSNRVNSMRHGACNYLCPFCNQEYSNNKEMRTKWQQIYKKEFLKNHTEEEFIKIFWKNYVDK